MDTGRENNKNNKKKFEKVRASRGSLSHQLPTILAMVQSAPKTSKTAKKHASPAPTRHMIIDIEPGAPVDTASFSPPEEHAEEQEGQEAEDGIPVKPTLSFKRRNKRVKFEIPRVSFRRLVEEIAAGCKSDLRFQQDAMEALQESAENVLSERFVRCAELAELCKLDTVRDDHWRFVRDTAADVPCSGKS